ncbi:thioredoxin fold domain-containing protein [Nonlabens sp.]|uniref:thioredoxin family protein n=1 Tax=Nonlabens sp. TaxID=1888209 RepID=UPI003266A54F
MRYNNIFSILFVVFAFPLLGFTQEPDTPAVYNFEQLEQAFTKEDKPAVIFLHTNWCRYCKGMSEGTFGDSDLIKLINKDFYYVPFDAESKETIIFRNVQFGYESTGVNTGIHQLAKELLSHSEDKSYPVLLIINKDLEILYQYSGFLDQKEVTDILNNLI